MPKRLSIAEEIHMEFSIRWTSNISSGIIEAVVSVGISEEGKFIAQCECAYGRNKRKYRRWWMDSSEGVAETCFKGNIDVS